MRIAGEGPEEKKNWEETNEKLRTKSLPCRKTQNRVNQQLKEDCFLRTDQEREIKNLEWIVTLAGLGTNKVSGAPCMRAAQRRLIRASSHWNLPIK